MTMKIQPECPFCDVKLIFINEYGFYKCPDCGGEWWPGRDDYDVITLWRDEQAYKKSMAKKGGASGRSGKKKKVKSTKKKQYWLYDT